MRAWALSGAVSTPGLGLRGVHVRSRQAACFLCSEVEKPAQGGQTAGAWLPFAARSLRALLEPEGSVHHVPVLQRAPGAEPFLQLRQQESQRLVSASLCEAQLLQLEASEC